ncbi:hypothetical protein [Mycolicibacterium llatzerense]|nr:hypothetical protein [Mycolicibacterium llatzerense]
MFTLRIHPLRLMLPNVRFGVAPVHHRTAVVDLPGLTWRGRFDAGQRTIAAWLHRPRDRRTRQPRFHGAHESLFRESAMEREMHRL